MKIGRVKVHNQATQAQNIFKVIIRASNFCREVEVATVIDQKKKIFFIFFFLYI